MNLLFSILPWIIGFLGIIVGSFLNVVIIRHGSGMGIGGRSMCPQCHKQLAWYELIPVISFLVQRGTCKDCHKKISIQYPIIELITGMLFFLATKHSISLFFSIPSFWFWGGLLLILLLVSLIIIIVVHDIKTQTIPVAWLGLLAIVGILFLIFYYSSYQIFFITLLTPHIIGVITSVPFLVIYLFSHGRWIGFADIEIIAWIGFMQGFINGLSTVLLSFYIGALFAVLLIGYKMIVKQRPYNDIRKQSIAFAPFLFLGFFITMFSGFSLFSLVGKLFI